MGDRVLWAFRHDLPGESDEQLIDRARSGDKSAFGELYRRHRKAAESTAWCLLRSKSDADDVVSDAFAGVLSALRNGRGPRDNFRGYLLACVRNGCRTRRPPTVLVDEDQLERWNPAIEDPDKYVEADTVARAFSSLAPRWQHTLWMTEVEQLPANEVSERLDLSPNATAALTHRARQAFAEAYLAEHVGATTDKDCKRIAPLLPGYVRNQLRDLQQATVERHLVNCQRCAAAVDDLRDVNASLRSLLPVTVPALGAAAVGTQSVATTGTVGGFTLGLPGTGVLLKGLVAVLLVAPLLSTDSPFDGGDDEDRQVAIASPTAIATPPVPALVTATVPPPVETAAPVTTDPVELTSPPPPEPAADPGGGAEDPPTPTVAITTLPAPAPGPVLVVPPPIVELVDQTVQPLIRGLTEPVVETLDEALAMMGLGTTGRTVVVLRSLLPLLDGPLLGPVVDQLFDLTSLGEDAGAIAPDASNAIDDADGPQSSADGADPTLEGPTGTAPVTIPPAVPGPAVTVPAVTLPVISGPPVTVPPVTVPPVTVPPVTVPPVTLPAATLPAVTLPAVTLPAVTVPRVTVPTLPL